MPENESKVISLHGGSALLQQSHLLGMWQSSRGHEEQRSVPTQNISLHDEMTTVPCVRFDLAKGICVQSEASATVNHQKDL
jgi:hypothetical protein